MEWKYSRINMASVIQSQMESALPELHGKLQRFPLNLNMNYYEPP